MTPNTITLLFKEARDTFPPFKGNPADDDLLLIQEMLFPILMEIPYNQLGRAHLLTAILVDPAKYATDHGGAPFHHPIHLPLYDASIADDATTVVRIRAKASHKARLNDYASYEVAERGTAKFLCKTIDKVW